MRVRELGRVDYEQCWQSMREFTRLRGAATQDELWLVEHPPVFTLGLAGRREHLLDPGAIPVVASDRGGQVTYHGPGQAIVYALIDLQRAGYFVRELVRRVEDSVLETLSGFGLAGRRVPGAPGIYVPLAGDAKAAQNTHRDDAQAEARFHGLAKIAALGIKIHRGCSYHGVALNVDMDLAPFRAIDPCGFRGLQTVDLATLGIRSDWQSAGRRLAELLSVHADGERTT
jgi:lipoyl(octanoyl) transferase